MALRSDWFIEHCSKKLMKAANFGRYSSHWHVLSPHRTVDVADIAWR